ncbi:MAG: DUF2332 family protein [Alphaproteobacteria bacterium]|nr:DUF2332 family protein [Alphaproteobacteria bacterium]MBU1548337.1 DUF2332 family protein [Alphaproteobacteria bacterium]MBU2335901.1 DUF2332 family protein [Alphaproteobacteria bacterium]MBU2390704.1 DUF2332 family protein [Alphaproteobacteria bacterium]
MADEDAVREAFERQARACAALGSPFTARLCRMAAARLDPSDPVGRTILEWPGDASGGSDALPLRLAGALHALVLSDRDEQLKAAYPPHDVADDDLWNATTAAKSRHEAFILDRLTSAPQTNEIRRSAVLLPGFLTIAARFGLPLDVLEIGASAGLNLQWDRYHYRLGGSEWGDPASAVHLAPDWQGPNPPLADVRVRHRLGCDLNPLDPTSPDDRLRLMSYVWADQRDRMERLAAALAIAAPAPPTVERADALSWLPRVLARPAEGAVRVIYHSIAWQYLPPDDQAEGEAVIAEAGSRATPEAPLARLAMEADGNTDGAAISLQLWPGGERQDLGRADFHGRWVKWKGWS